MATIPPPRITLLTAELAPVIVALCRVRSKLWRIVSIDALSGAADLGWWRQTHAFPRCSKLSPTGKWLSFAELRGFAVGSPPRMEPCYFYEGPSSNYPADFPTENAIGDVHGDFVASSDGSLPPFVHAGVSARIGQKAMLLLRKLEGRRNQCFTMTIEKVQKKGTWDYESRVSTTPDFGVIDDRVRSAVTLVTGELVIARLGVVTCYEIDEALKATERWRADLTRLHDDFVPAESRTRA